MQVGARLFEELKSSSEKLHFYPWRANGAHQLGVNGRHFYEEGAGEEGSLLVERRMCVYTSREMDGE